MAFVSGYMAFFTALTSVLCSSQVEGGGFGGSERHDPHMLYTLSAVQVMALYDRLDELDADRIAACAPRAVHTACIVGLQTPCALRSECCGVIWLVPP